MTWSHSFWINALFVVIAIGGAEEVIRRLVGKPVARAWRKVEKFLDTWNGEPERDGLPARPGLVDRVIRIEYQVHNNGGGSLKDDVDEVKKTTNRIETASKLAAAKATKAAEMAEAAAQVATATKDALDAHVEQSQALVEQGAADKAALWLEAERHTQTVTELAKAVQIAAQSTPPEESHD